MVDISSFEGNESDAFESVNESLTSIFRRAKFPPIDRFHASIIFFLSKEDFIFHPIYLLFCPSFIYSASRPRQKQLLSPFDNHHQPEDGGIFFENTARIYRIYRVAGISADFLYRRD